MNKVEAYIFLFVDSLMESVVVPLHHPYAYTVIKSTGDYNLFFITLLTAAGYTVGLLINMLLGRIVTSIPMKRDEEKTKTYELLKRLASQYGFLLILAVGWITSLATLVSIAAGILKMRFSIAALSFLTSISGYYAYIILLS